MTRFCCGSPTPRFQEDFTVFRTRPLEYQDKFTKSEVRNFASPKAFHTLKVQGFNGNLIVFPHKPKCQFKEVVSPLIGDLLMDTTEVTLGTIPAIREILLA